MEFPSICERYRVVNRQGFFVRLQRAPRERDGKIFEFRKTLFLYNGSRIKAPVDDLIVVESFTSVWWLFQNGLPDVVATMGSDCSEKQAELIVSLVKPGGHAWMLTDGDPAGDRHAKSHFAKVSLHRFVRWVKMADGKQPTDFTIFPQREKHWVGVLIFKGFMGLQRKARF